MAATSAKRAPRNFWGVERLKTADLLNGFAEVQRSRAPAPGRDSSTTLSMRERSIFANVVFKKHGLRASSRRRAFGAERPEADGQICRHWRIARFFCRYQRPTGGTTRICPAIAG